MALLPHLKEGRLEAGCDEAGRGCLAGPVSAAAVILPDNFHHPLINDSKKLSHKLREELRYIIEAEALAWKVIMLDNEEIDQFNILKASFIGMHRAIEALSTQPEFLLIDGNRFIPYDNIEHQCIIKGDGKFSSIAAASILAKTHRDELMLRLDDEYPQYGWANNKGYPTSQHREAIAEYGISPYHRKSFKLHIQTSLF